MNTGWVALCVAHSGKLVIKYLVMSLKWDSIPRLTDCLSKCDSDL
jgi:hypothetical protein